MIVPLTLAVILALVHFFSEEYSRHVDRFHVHTISFSAGLLLGVIFLYLLPEFFRGLPVIGENIFLFMLLGFVFFHMTEKFVYQHVKNKDELLQELSSIHAIGFFVNHFLVGITLFLAFNIEGSLSVLLLFVPLLLHTFSSSLSLTHIDSHFQRKSLSGFLLPASPVLGVLFASLVNLSPYIYRTLFSFVLGAMLYIAVRDALPRAEKGRPFLFLAGILISIAAILVISLA